MASAIPTAKRSIHAKERCHSRKIRTEEVDACIATGERMKETRSKESVTHGDVKLIQSRKDGTVVTAIRDTVQYHDVSLAKGEQCMKSGLIQSMREQLSLLIKYEVRGHNGVFVINGDPDRIQKAIHRIEKTKLKKAQAGAKSIIRVASPRDVVGHIIGKGGSNLKSIQKKANIMYYNLKVQWDKEASEIVVSSTIRLDDRTASILEQAIESIVKKQCN